ncbi:MAG: 2-oxoacid:acceptor oxidoreductase family protein [Planctomycetaceae bacterium]|nr:2-oxoacid:acceptor oxidoreductase family protein [Planctomycetaceae bacterium]
MTAAVTNVVLAGLGGQGVIKASDILAQAAFDAGFDVKKSEIHGMSQRGGFVASDVRFGEQVLSPMIPAGEADILVLMAVDQLEAARPCLKAGGQLIMGAEIDIKGMPPRCLNVAVLGALSSALEIPRKSWHAAIEALLPAKSHEENLRAFEAGRRV